MQAVGLDNSISEEAAMVTVIDSSYSYERPVPSLSHLGQEEETQVPGWYAKAQLVMSTYYALHSWMKRTMLTVKSDMASLPKADLTATLHAMLGWVQRERSDQ